MAASLNQQFAWCELLLAQWGADSLPWRQDALVQSLSWHLHIAYCALLRDMAGAARLPLTVAPTSVLALIERIPDGRNCPAEWEELAQLESGDSWLSALRSQPATPAQVLDTGQAQNALIASSQGAALDVNGCREALVALKRFTERWRELGQEY
ncbi:DUF6586 family protein [Simiduia agarivorans]|uniref:Uncharacterized protein n=1 Tax=Simiduia agarivorans (strain DSM 21679 / JCM 13881 / BCRC 17597 / SA1) TaxID=1117647 RepID=K4KEI1_SIMAS|nr:DUF6586 family protein [Simiduia agarivorans]AFU97459.1 hypothetical protein M5M_01140 [Simiduia agarivorans SA1 = DSM 21679]